MDLPTEMRLHAILRYQDVMESAENASETLHLISSQDIGSMLMLASLHGLMTVAHTLGPASKLYKQHESEGRKAVEDLDRFEVMGQDRVRET